MHQQQLHARFGASPTLPELPLKTGSPGARGGDGLPEGFEVRLVGREGVHPYFSRRSASISAAGGRSRARSTNGVSNNRSAAADVLRYSAGCSRRRYRGLPRETELMQRVGAVDVPSGLFANLADSLWVWAAEATVKLPGGAPWTRTRLEEATMSGCLCVRRAAQGTSSRPLPVEHGFELAAARDRGRQPSTDLDQCVLHLLTGHDGWFTVDLRLTLRGCMCRRRARVRVGHLDRSVGARHPPGQQCRVPKLMFST